MKRPNIILIMADMMRWDCAGFAGNPDVRTPNLDALAAKGAYFPQTICPFPLCVPSRMSFLTGLYPSQHGVVDNRQSLAHGADTLPRRLQHAGYQTAGVGKMHFNPPRADYGFDRLLLAEQDGEGRYVDDYHRWLKRQGRFDQVDAWDQIDRDTAPRSYWDSFGAMRSNLPERFYSTTWIGDQALQQVRSMHEPFFLWVSFVKPHHPFDPPEPWDEMYDRAALRLPPDFRLPVPEADRERFNRFDLGKMNENRFRRVLAYYYATISHMDKQIGRLLATLTARGITNNLIVFCADHGEYMGQHGLLTKIGQTYDSLLRIPLLVAGLAGQRQGLVSNALVEMTDLFPTLLEAVGESPPGGIPGKSLVPVLRSGRGMLRRVAYAEAGNDSRIARSSRYKLIESSREDLCAFYDLSADPCEFDNLHRTSSLAKEQAAMRASLARKRPAQPQPREAPPC